MLLAEGIISRNQFEQATMLQARQGGTIGCQLVRLGAITADELVEFLTQRLGSAFWPRSKMRDLPPEVTKLITSEIACDLRILPLAVDGYKLALGLTDPSRHHVIEEAAYHTGCEIVPVIVSEDDMDWALEHYYQGSTPTVSPDIMAPADDLHDDDEPVLRVSGGGWNLDSHDALGLRENIFEKKITGTDGDDDGLHVEPLQPGETPIPDEPAKKRIITSPQVALRAPVKVGPPPSSSGPRENPLMSSSPAADEASRKLSEGELIAAIHKASSRNEIIDFALEYLRHFAERAAFFIVKKEEIRGYEIVGDLTSRSAIRSFWVPMSSRSTLHDAAIEQSIHLGPLGRNPADAILSAALGGRPERILAIPVEIGNRVVGLLYADRLSVKMPPWNRLERLAEVVGFNLRRLIVNREK